MAWDGNGNFTRTDGSHSGATTWADADADGDDILASTHDTHDEDLADGIQACLTKNGETKPTADFKPNADATYNLGSAVLRWVSAFVQSIKIVASGNTLTLTATPTGNRTVTLQDATHTVAALNIEDQTLAGGVIVTSKSLGEITTGTVTPDPGDRPLQHYTNGGAHTLAPSANAGTVVVDVTNNASAGAVTTSGFTLVTGAFTTTDTHKFRCFISIGNGGSLLQIQALQ